jgi:hypothetical protein
LSSGACTWLEDTKIWSGSNIFRISNSKEETELNLSLLHSISKNVYVLARQQSLILQEIAGETMDKSTIFILSDGKVFLAGKAYRVEKKVSQINNLVDIITQLCLPSQSEDVDRIESLEASHSSLMGSSIEQLVSALCYCDKNTRKTTPRTLDFLPLAQLSSGRIDNKLNKIGEKILACVCELAKEKAEVWSPIIVEIVIRFLQTSCNSQSKESLSQHSSTVLSADTIKLIIQSLFKSDANLTQMFLAQGGLSIIADYLRVHDFNLLTYNDTLTHSPVISDILNLSFTQSRNKKLNGKVPDRIRKDSDGVPLENFAPSAKIQAPPPVGADVLLIDKSPLRRSRFAAWAHQFAEGDAPWISLVITFPFEILLKEAAIHMHSSYLGGAPIVFECSRFAFSGLSNKVNIFLTICSTSPSISLERIVVSTEPNMRRVCICRNGSDHLKLNLIELFGRSVFSGNDRPFMVSQQTVPIQANGWMSLFMQLLLDTPHAINKLKSYIHLDELMSQMVISIPLLQIQTLRMFGSVQVESK